MIYRSVENGHRTACTQCPLRKVRLFEPFSPETLEFMLSFKTAEIQVAAGTPVLVEGAGSDHLYTVLRGMGIRFKTLETGARQVVNFVMPGDFLGLQAAVMGEMKHSVSATTAMTLCVFDRRKLWDLFTNEPQRAFDRDAGIPKLGVVEDPGARSLLEIAVKTHNLLDLGFEGLKAKGLLHDDLSNRGHKFGWIDGHCPLGKRCRIDRLCPTVSKPLVQYRTILG